MCVCECASVRMCVCVSVHPFGVQVSWHDLAFFDPVMYESLRQLTVDARLPGGRGTLADQHLVFQV